MIKRVFLLMMSCCGAVLAAPLEFYISPAEGVKTWDAPLQRVDADALAAAEQAAQQAETRYQQGLGTALECAVAQLALVRLRRPLWWSEVSTKMQRCELFNAARKVRRIIEKQHENKLASDERLYKAQLDDAWTRVLSLAGGRAPDVCDDKLKWAASLLGQLEELVSRRDRVELLLVQAAQGEVKIASNRWKADVRAAAMRETQQVYDELAGLMAEREKQGLCEADAAESARAAARTFRREACLEAKDNTPERVAALKERCDIFASLIPLIQQQAERERNLRFDAKYASRQLERMQQQYESARQNLPK